MGAERQGDETMSQTVLCGEWRLNDRVVFRPHNGAGPCGSPSYGKVVYVKCSDPRVMLVVWDDDPHKINEVPQWNERFQRLSEDEYARIKESGY